MPFLKFLFYIFSWSTYLYLEFYCFWKFWNHSGIFSFLDMKHDSSTQTFNSQWAEVPARWGRRNLGREGHGTQLAHPTELYKWGNGTRQQVWITGLLGIRGQVFLSPSSRLYQTNLSFSQTLPGESRGLVSVSWNLVFLLSSLFLYISFIITQTCILFTSPN